MRSCVLRLVRGGLPVAALLPLPPLLRRRRRPPPPPASLSEALEASSKTVRSRWMPAAEALSCSAAVPARGTGVSLVLPACNQLRKTQGRVEQR